VDPDYTTVWTVESPIEYGMPARPNRSGTDDLSNDDSDQSDECPDDSASDGGWRPHLEHGEPRRRWVRAQAEDQAQKTTKCTYRRCANDRESRDARHGDQLRPGRDHDVSMRLALSVQERDRDMALVRVS
jgi:hypothetical protein